MKDYSWHPERAVPKQFPRKKAESGLVMSQVPRGDLWQVLLAGPDTAAFAEACIAALGVAPETNRVVSATRRDGTEIAMVWAAAGDVLVSGAIDPADVAAKLEGVAYLLDQSDGRAILCLEGPSEPLRGALSKLLPLDLRASAFGPGYAAATLLDHMPVNVWCRATADAGNLAVCLAVFRSYEESLHAALAEAGFKFAGS